MKNLRHDKIILAVPKGRILDELIPLLNKADIVPEKSFFDNNNESAIFFAASVIFFAEKQTNLGSAVEPDVGIINLTFFNPSMSIIQKIFKVFWRNNRISDHTYSI